MKPKPRPLHRSLTFWAGILVITFLCWAWWRSIGHHDSVGVHRYGISNMQSQLHIEVNRVPIWEKWPSQVGQSRIPPAYRTTAFPKPRWQEVIGAPVTQAYITIPHWLILLIVVPPWCGLMIWLVLRKRRAEEARRIEEAVLSSSSSSSSSS